MSLLPKFRVAGIRLFINRIKTTLPIMYRGLRTMFFPITALP